MKKILNMTPWVKDSDVYVSKFKLVEKNPDFSPVFHSSMHYFGDCWLRNFQEVKKELGVKFAEYRKLNNNGIILITELNKQDIFEVHWWFNATSEEKIIDSFKKIAFIIELAPD